MTDKENIISAGCPLFVCSECHTKTGHPHRKWCPKREETAPDCSGCLYRRGTPGECVHPYKKKGGDGK